MIITFTPFYFQVHVGTVVTDNSITHRQFPPGINEQTAPTLKHSTVIFLQPRHHKSSCSVGAWLLQGTIVVCCLCNDQTKPVTAMSTTNRQLVCS